MFAWVSPTDVAAPTRGCPIVLSNPLLSKIRPPPNEGAPTTAELSIAPKIVEVTVTAAVVSGMTLAMFALDRKVPPAKLR